jgi:hypothetical protein
MLREHLTSRSRNRLLSVKKRNNEKMARKKKSFPTYKNVVFCFSLLFGPLLLSKLITFIFLVHFK